MGAVWPLRASAAPIWGHCSGYLAASSQFPNLGSDEADRGTAAHWALSETLTAWRDSGSEPDTGRYVGLAAPNGVVVDEELAEGAQVMVDDVVATAGSCRERLVVEHGVSMPRIHPQNGGTLDVSLWMSERNVLFLWDYKNGHRICPAKGNLQLVDYAEGMASELGLHELGDVTVVFRIVQPFCYQREGAIDEWVCKLSDLRPYVNQLYQKGHESFSNPILTSGAHCRDCPAVGKCSAARIGTYNFIDVVGRPYEMDAMTGAELAIERGIIERGMSLAKARLEAIEDDLIHRIKAGEANSGLVLQSSYGNLEWKGSEAEAKALAQQFGINITKEGVLTPTQAKQKAPKEVRQIFEQVVDANTFRKPKGFTLTPQEGSVAARAFSKK